MSLDIDRAVHEGFDRLLSRNGLILIALMIVVSFMNSAVWQTLQGSLLSGVAPPGLPGGGPAGGAGGGLGGGASAGAESGGGNPLSLGLGTSTAAILFFLTLPIRALFRIIVVRVFGSKFTDSIPSELLTKNIGRAVFRDLVTVLFVYLIAFLPPLVVMGAGAAIQEPLLILVGFLLFFVITIPAMVFLYFVRQEIAISNRGILGALRGSYELTKDDRWNTLGLILILGLIRLILFIPALIAIVGAFALGALAGGGLSSPGGGILGLVIGIIVGAAINLFGISATTRGYMELRQKRI